MSKRVSASASALPIDGPDLDHVTKPLNFLDGSDVSHGLNGHNGNAGTKSVLARSQTKRTKFVPLDWRATVAHVMDKKSATSHPEIDIATSAISTTASQNPVPHAGASETRFMVARVEAPCRAASGSQAALEAKKSTKLASPVLARAHSPQAVALKPSHGKRNLVEKPASVLPDLPEIYGMRTEGDCMVPEILDGHKIIVSKTEEVKRGDTVCLWLKNPSRPEGYSALVKKVAMLPPPHVTFPYAEHPESEVVALVFVEQINPPRAYQFRCDQILAMHKVIDVQAEDGTSVMKAVEPVRASKRIVEERPTPYGLLEAYKTWLGLELRHLCGEMAEDPVIIASNYPSLVNEPDFKKRADLIERIFSFVGQSGSWHFGRDDKASDRAALVLTAVGCDWREEG